MKIKGLYINDKAKHILAFSFISLALSWFFGPLWGIILSLIFSISKGLHDWREDISHSMKFLRISTLRIPSEFLFDQGSDIIGIAIGVTLWMSIFHKSFFP